MNENDDKNNKNPIYGKFQAFCGRLKKIKHIEAIVCIVLIAVTLLCISGYKDASDETVENAPTDETDVEKRLEKVLSEIAGAGSVSVMITYDGTAKTVTATTNTENTVTREDDSGGAKLKTVTVDRIISPVTVRADGKDVPVVLKRLNPEIVGVIVVADGAGDLRVRMKLLQAVSTALDVETNRIEVYSKK